MKTVLIIERENFKIFEEVCDLYGVDITQFRLDPKGKSRFYVDVELSFPNTLFVLGQSYEARINGLLGVKSFWGAIKKIFS